MNFLSSIYKKYYAAVAAAFAVISIPAQATDCATVCEDAARSAGYAAVQQAQATALDDCKRQAQPSYNMTQWMNYCMGTKVPEFNAAYNNAYQQTLAQCNGSCH